MDRKRGARQESRPCARGGRRVERLDFLHRHPRLWHLAHADGWPGIEEHGLLSAQALVRLCQVPEKRAERLLSARRLTAERLTLPDGEQAVLRDQKPLHEGKLHAALEDGLSVAQWLRMLNGLVFFFPSRQALQSLYTVYRQEPAVVLEVDTRRLFDDYDSLLRVAHINTGSTLYSAAKRGRTTFRPVGQFDARKQVKEVAVVDRVPEVLRYLVGVELWLPDGTTKSLAY